MVVVPTVGRVVLYFPKKSEGLGNGPLASLVTAVDQDDDDKYRVNLAVFDNSGGHHDRQYVLLWQDGEKQTDDPAHCEWMPYQTGQAKRTDRAEGELTKRLSSLEGKFARSAVAGEEVMERLAELEKRLCQPEVKPNAVGPTG